MSEQEQHSKPNNYRNGGRKKTSDPKINIRLYVRKSVVETRGTQDEFRAWAYKRLGINPESGELE